REYLSALRPLLDGERVMYEGETLKAFTVGPLEIEAPAPQLLIAALAPAMLRLAGSLADGTITWMTGVRTIESHIVPSITTAAAGATDWIAAPFGSREECQRTAALLTELAAR